MEFIYRSLTAIPAFISMGYSIQKLFPLQRSYWKRFLLYFLLYITFTLPCWLGDENPILLFPLFLLGFLMLLSGDKLPKLVFASILYTLFISLNTLFDSLFNTGGALFLAMLLIKMLIWCALAWFLNRIAPKGGLQMPKKLWLLLGGLMLGPLVSTLSFSIWGYRLATAAEFLSYRSTLERLGFTVIPFALFSALSLLIAAVVLSRHEALEQESKLSALREVYYTGLKQEQVGLRTLRHDLRNHVTVLQGLLEQNKQEALAQYLKDLESSSALNGGKCYTANETANVVLSSKAQRMAELGLIPCFEVMLPENLSIPAPELCALLGNALDNAMEGAAGADNPMITLRTRLEKGVFMLQVHNAIYGKINPDLSTTKTDPTLHGLGLAGMREIAVRHGGSLKADVKDGCFELLVCFPCQE